MRFNLENIHIGKYIRKRVEEQEISIISICNFLHVTENEVDKMYAQKSMDTERLLQWSKVLEYDFFRLYTQHLILFSPFGNTNSKNKTKNISLPQFRKNIYTKEVVDFVLELINTGEKTKQQIIEEYRIPKTTLHKWMHKYNKQI